MRDGEPRALSEWLRLMLAEIAAKREAEQRERAEEARRRLERAAAAAPEAPRRSHFS